MSYIKNLFWNFILKLSQDGLPKLKLSKWDKLISSNININN